MHAGTLPANTMTANTLREDTVRGANVPASQQASVPESKHQPRNHPTSTSSTVCSKHLTSTHLESKRTLYPAKAACSQTPLKQAFALVCTHCSVCATQYLMRTSYGQAPCRGKKRSANTTTLCYSRPIQQNRGATPL